MPKNQKGFAFVLLLVIVMAICSVLLITANNQNKVFQPIVEEVVNIFVTPTPTPFPFEEMTIPSLRGRKYTSGLHEMSRVGDYTSYSSYVTSYDSDGLKVYGLLTIPKGEKPDKGWPAVVFVHGYIPPQNYRTTVNYVSWTNYLADKGFVVFKIDLRGHDSSEGEPGGGYYSADYVIDTLNAISALKSADFVDEDAIGLWGHSMAGNVVLRALAAKPDIPAVNIWAGAGYTYSDLQDYRIQDTSYQPPPPDSDRAKKRIALRAAYGEFSPDHWFWKQIPATNYLDGISGFIQLNHAIDDTVVGIEYSRNLISILDKTSIPHELKEYSSGGHNLTGTSFTQALRSTEQFFKKALVN